MKKTFSSLTLAALALFGAQAVMAQAASAPTRADVKKETAAANKAGAIPGTGTGPSANASPPISAKSDVPRADVKQEAAAANKAGAIPGTGTSNIPAAAAGQVSPKAAAATSDTTRDARKKATAEANKAGTIPGANKSAEIPAKQ